MSGLSSAVSQVQELSLAPLFRKQDTATRLPLAIALGIDTGVSDTGYSHQATSSYGPSSIRYKDSTGAELGSSLLETGYS